MVDWSIEVTRSIGWKMAAKTTAIHQETSWLVKIACVACEIGTIYNSAVVRSAM